jgi:hypothetical protein
MGTYGEESADADEAEDEPENATGKTEGDAFGEELANDAKPAGAQGGTDGELTFSAGGADEEEIGDVRAGDEEYETDGSEQDKE